MFRLLCRGAILELVCCYGRCFMQHRCFEKTDSSTSARNQDAQDLCGWVQNCIPSQCHNTIIKDLQVLCGKDVEFS